MRKRIYHEGTKDTKDTKDELKKVNHKAEFLRNL
jgi:hypothetical protein